MTDADYNPMEFTYPLSREACFSNGLCTTFGRSDVKARVFVAWTLSCGWEDCTSSPPLFTSTGMTVGSRWADFEDEMTEPVGCMQHGYSSTAGVALELAATTGELFAPPCDAETTEVFVAPSPEEVVVYELWSGDRLFVEAYCAEFGVPEWVTAP